MEIVDVQLKSCYRTQYLLDQFDASLQIQSEIDELPLDALALVFLRGVLVLYDVFRIR